VLLPRFLWNVHIPTHYNKNYLLDTCSRVLLEKLTGLQLIKKFPAFYGTRRFITALTTKITEINYLVSCSNPDLKSNVAATGRHSRIMRYLI
jgi:hypothetical protein